MSCLNPSEKWRHLKIVSRWSEGVGAFDHMRGLTRCAAVQVSARNAQVYGTLMVLCEDFRLLDKTG